MTFIFQFMSLNGCIRLTIDHVRIIPIHQLHPMKWKKKKQEIEEHFKIMSSTDRFHDPLEVHEAWE